MFQLCKSPVKKLHSSADTQDDRTTTVKGYVHLFSPVNVASNGKTKCFDLKMQTASDEAVRLVCFSPEKRLHFHESQLKRQPLQVKATQKSPKRLGKTFDEYTVGKKSKILPARLDFTFNATFSNRYHTLEQTLQASVFETVDVKVKILTKSDDKQPILKEGTTKFKIDSIIADHTSSMKLVIWESCFDKIHASKCYHIQNCRINIFDDSKYLNTNENTIISEIENIQDIELTSPEIKDCLAIASCLGLDMSRHSCCILCNKKLPLSKPEDDMITCTNCNITTLLSVVQTKLICNLVLSIDGKIVSYTAFNDPIQSFFTNVRCDTPISSIGENELTRLLLHAGPQ